jgi:hypothetical protein
MLGKRGVSVPEVLLVRQYVLFYCMYVCSRAIGERDVKLIYRKETHVAGIPACCWRKVCVGLLTGQEVEEILIFGLPNIV